MWGVAAQVYGLRRAGDGGIGDAGAVRDLAVAAARHGADAVALSPVHSLFAADPARHGPYSPSSRLFLNPLYGDPSIVFGPERLASHATVADEPAPLIDWTAAGALSSPGCAVCSTTSPLTDLAGGTPLAADFERFVREGGEALREHALFEAAHATQPGNWTDWQAGWRHPADTAVADFLKSGAASEADPQKGDQQRERRAHRARLLAKVENLGKADHDRRDVHDSGKHNFAGADWNRWACVTRVTVRRSPGWSRPTLASSVASLVTVGSTGSLPGGGPVAQLVRAADS